MPPKLLGARGASGRHLTRLGKAEAPRGRHRWGHRELMAKLDLVVPLACPRRDLAGSVKVGAGAEARAGPGPGRTELRARSPGPAYSPEKSSWRSPPRGPHSNAVRGRA